MPEQKPDIALPPLPARLRLIPEFRLLLASTWVVPATQVQAQAERIAAACQGGIDWDVFLSLVDRHRVLVLHDALRRVLGDRLPDRVYEQLKSRKAEACKLALRHAAELLRLNKAFRAQGIEMLPLKGMMLSLQLFGDPAMRSARDLDLLVRPEKLDEADRILRDAGYRLAVPDCELTPKRRKWVRQHSHHFGYYHDDRRQLIELHWRLLLWKTEHVAELWNHCEATSWMGTSFLNLKDDALLLLLCDHGAKHQWSRTKWLSDVAGLLAQERRFSWENILALADRFDLALALAQAGMLMRWLYEIPLPQPWLGLVANEKRSVPLAAHAVDAMLLSEKEQFALPARLKNAVYPVRIRKRLRGHVSLSSCLLSTDEFKECPLPDRLFWLYFPLRPLLWFYHHYIKSKASP